MKVAIGLYAGLLVACGASAPPSTTPPAPLASTPPATVTGTTGTTTSPQTTTESLDPIVGFGLETVGEGYREPILLIALPGSERLLVMERGGMIRVLGEDTVWLDISERVNSEDGIEPGLLGMAFHPEFTSNGRFFLYYYRSGYEQTRLAEFSAPSGVPDPDSERALIDIDKPTNRHNGGMLQFGPDGLLYLSVGEGGKASVNSQHPETLLGKILRIDIDRGGAVGNMPYGIPEGNPFADGGAGAPEVLAWGLRNPWRTWIDPVSEIMYIADVGQEDIEEIDAVALSELAGTNFGWLRMEGSACFQRGCDPVAEGLTLPVLEYSHEEGCSVTGGVVYRGAAIPELEGHYLYADWCFGWVRSFRLENGEAGDIQLLAEDAGQVNGFGVDAAGEVYLLCFDGTIKRLEASRQNLP